MKDVNPDEIHPEIKRLMGKKTCLQILTIKQKSKKLGLKKGNMTKLFCRYGYHN